MTRNRRAAVRRVVLSLVWLACLFVAGCASQADGASTKRYADPGVGLVGVGTLPAPASAWPEAGHDARWSSGTTAIGPQRGRIRWSRDLGGDATPGPVVAVDGSILAATHAGVLHDLDAATGRDRWTFDGGGAYGSDLSTSPAVLTGGTILWPGPNDTLFALDASGRKLWSERFGGQVLSPALGGRNRVYVADLAGHLTALEITGATHRRVWTLDTSGVDYASPSIGPDGTIYTVGGDGGKVLLAVRDLGSRPAVRWRFHTTRMIEVSNAVAPDGTVLVGTNNDHQFGITSSGAIRWQQKIGDYSYSSSVVRPDGTGYFGDNSGNLWTLDTANGDVRRKVNPVGTNQEKIWTSPAVDARGDVYWGTTEGRAYGYSPRGRQLFALSLGAGINSYPAIGADGTLYLGTTAGRFVAIG